MLYLNKCLSWWVLSTSNAEATKGWEHSAFYGHKKRPHCFSGLSSEFSYLCSRLSLLQRSCTTLEKSCVRTGCEMPFPCPLFRSCGYVHPPSLILISATLKLCLWLAMDFADDDLIRLTDSLARPQACLMIWTFGWPCLLPLINLPLFSIPWHSVPHQ